VLCIGSWVIRKPASQPMKVTYISTKPYNWPKAPRSIEVEYPVKQGKGNKQTLVYKFLTGAETDFWEL
jgi:hypothetical protein